MKQAYWLNADGTSYWGVPLYTGQPVREINKAIHSMTIARKRQVYTWQNFFTNA